MKFTSKQQKDLETITFFIPKAISHIKITEEDIQKFFEYSDQGKHREDKQMSHFEDGFNALVEGKRWRGVHMGLWEEGVLEGSVPYFTLLGGYENNKRWWQFWKSKHKPIPRSVVDFMEKEMFKGADAELIENCYRKILK